MGSTTARIRTCNKRLLIMQNYVKLLITILFCSITGLLYAQQNLNSIALKISTNELSIGDELEVEVIINRNTLYTKKLNGIPHFILTPLSDTVQLTQSSIFPEGEELYLRYRYRFTTVGQFHYTPHLTWDRRIFNLEPLSITVHHARLSAHTPFLWKIYSFDGKLIPENTTLEQGTPYILCLTAAFYADNYQASYTSALYDAAAYTSLREKRPQSTHKSPVLPLPVEILRISCESSEYAAIKSIALEEFPFDSTALSYTGDEQYILALFSSIPLKTGVQPLPKATVYFAAGDKTFSVPRTCTVTKKSAASTHMVSQKDRFTAPAFKEVPQKIEHDSTIISSKERSAIAQQIAEYRKQEAAALFAPSIQRERKTLEAALHITHPLPLYPRILAIIPAIGAVVLLLTALLCYVCLKARRRLLVVLVIGAACSGICSTVLFNRIIQRQGVCIAANGTCTVRRIPEELGSMVYELSTGDSVIILRKTPKWYYVKTSEGFTGWIIPNAISEYN